VTSPLVTPQSYNRIVERDKFSGQVEVWHCRDEGDLRERMFHLPRLTCPAVKAGRQRCGECRICTVIDKAIRMKGVEWIEWLAKQGVRVKDVRPHGPYPALEMDHLDEDVYIISARAVREKPLLMKQEKAAELFAEQPYQDDRPGVRHIWDNLTPEMIEQQAREQRAAEQKEKRDRPKREALKKRIADRRRAIGAPVYDPNDERSEA